MANELLSNGIWKRIFSTEFDIGDYDFDSLGGTRRARMAVNTNLRLGIRQARETEGSE